MVHRKQEYKLQFTEFLLQVTFKWLIYTDSNRDSADEGYPVFKDYMEGGQDFFFINAHLVGITEKKSSLTWVLE